MRINPQLDFWQIAFIAYKGVFATGMCMMLVVSELFEFMQSMTWWVVVAIGAVSAGTGALTAFLAQTGPALITEWARIRLGRVTLRPIALALVLYFSAAATLMSRSLAELTAVFLLETTPPGVILGAVLFTAAYAAWFGVASLVYVVQFIVLGGLALFIPVTILLVGTGDIFNLLPLWTPDAQLQKVLFFFIPFAGTEILWFFAPRANRKVAAHRAAATGIALAVASYAVMIIGIVASLGPHGAAIATYPLMAAAGSSEIPGIALQRFESALMIMWIPFIVGQISIMLFVAATSLTAGIPLLKTRVSMAIAVALVLAANSRIDSLPHLLSGIEGVGFIGAALGFSLPAYALIARLLKGSRREQVGHKSPND